MMLGDYVVRGTIGPYKSEPVTVRVAPTSGPLSVAYYVARFTYQGVEYSFRTRPMSPHPERLVPARVKLDEQATPKSIAAAAFRAAKAAAEQEADIVRREREQEGKDLDDIALAGVAHRSMGASG